MSDSRTYRCAECGWTGELPELHKSKRGARVCPICGGAVDEVDTSTARD